MTTTPAPQHATDTSADARRRVVVTGGARGIGGEIASRLAADGASVVIVDLLADEGRQHADAIGAEFIEADLSDPLTAHTMLAQAVDSQGGVDAFVNCAGILAMGPLLELECSTFDRVMAINARATMIGMQTAARRMIADGVPGRIVNLASMAAKHGGDNEAAYAASKAAVVSLTRAAALEWGRFGITVNAICPGYVLTDMGKHTRTPELIEAWTAMSPLGRLGTPEDVAGLVAFLLSPDAAYITGQSLDVSGGMVMH